MSNKIKLKCTKLGIISFCFLKTGQKSWDLSQLTDSTDSHGLFYLWFMLEVYLTKSNLMATKR